VQKKDRCGLTVDDAEVSSAAALPTKDGAHETAEHLRKEGLVSGKVDPQRVGERKDPLTAGGFGEESIPELRGGVGHAPADARRTERATLAGHGHHLLSATVSAADPDQAPAQNATVQIASKLALDERGIAGSAASFGLCEEGLQVLLYDLVQGCVLWISAPIGRR
jgi:hypothetical protein